MRLQKFLSAAGVCSRREGETYIVSGRVSVNGITVTELGTKVDPEKDRITVDGAPVAVQKKLVYIALNKPRGYVTTCRQGDEKIVVDLVQVPERVYPVGRLDKDSTGLLLLTNDGRIHHRLSHPSFDHEKEYLVTVADPIPDGALLKLEKGLPLMGRRTRAARVTRLSPRQFRIVLMEGRNRQIRRMVQKVGTRVTDLHRTRIANIRLGRLSPGAWRHLTGGEKNELLKSLGAPPF
ncbi:MAG: rRNA pseudouridine synthase [Desulfobacteraceae bacterium]|nr:MAG: rRNA pseudouridine synthase [Desulfobacteraceae bacterium]